MWSYFRRRGSQTHIFEICMLTLQRLSYCQLWPLVRHVGIYFCICTPRMHLSESVCVIYWLFVAVLWKYLPKCVFYIMCFILYHCCTFVQWQLSILFFCLPYLQYDATGCSHCVYVRKVMQQSLCITPVIMKDVITWATRWWAKRKKKYKKQ